MGFKETMMSNMMGKMSLEEKKQMMNGMMENFFGNMEPGEKQDLMKEMMPKMMGMMMGGNQQGGGNPMMGMMSMMQGMMGGGKDGEESFNPMDMCKQMMTTISNTSELATFATPEIRGLFEEWVQQVDEEILSLLESNKAFEPEELAKQLKLSRESVIYFLSRLAQKGKISLSGSAVDQVNEI